MAKAYEHKYLPLSIYGNVVSLLRGLEPSAGVHVDVGCGYGAIAEPVRDELGRTYIGFDLAEDGLDVLRERGFEARSIDLSDPVRAEAIIREAVGDQPIASLTFMDTLEHITNGADVLAMLRRLAEVNDAPLVLSVPNVAHKDIALKLLIGRWDMTEAGLLDYTHFGFYTERRLTRLMKSLGWGQVAAKDWLLEHSDQEFPASAPTLDHTLPIGHFLRELIDRANPNRLVNQFVRVFRLVEPEQLQLLEQREEQPRPFLSILFAVEGSNPDGLRQILHQLSEQTHQDFELQLIVDAANVVARRSVDELLSGLQPAFGRRITVRSIAFEGLVEATNAGLEDVPGRYVAILREGDELDSGWCAALVTLSEKNTGAVLRGGRGARRGDVLATKAPPQINDIGEVLPLALENPTSIAEFAIPAGTIRDLGLRLDDRVVDSPDWDLVTQAVLFCGLNYTPTAIVYGNASQAGFFLNADAKSGGYSRVTKLNFHPLLLPKGAAEGIRQLYEQVPDVRKVLAEDAGLAELVSELARVRADAATLQNEVSELRRAVDRLKYENAALAPARPSPPGDDAALRLRKVGLLLSQPQLLKFIKRYMPRFGDELVRPPDPVIEGGPFLSVITRTQGMRIRPLREALMCLAGQTSKDFELLLVVHSAVDSAYTAVEALVQEFPAAFQQRVTLLRCTRAGRAAPLNDAAARIRGQYVAVLDDDDFVLGHWVETFKTLADESPGSLLRAACARQDFSTAGPANDSTPPRATSWPTLSWPAQYDAIGHLHANSTPFMSVAFPATLFRDLDLRFDELLTTTEDWDFTNRVGMLCGVVTSPQVTSIYRWWADGESSSFKHPREEWHNNRNRIIGKLDALPVLLPPGSVERINTMTEQTARLAAVEAQLQQERSALQLAEAQLSELLQERATLQRIVEAQLSELLQEHAALQRNLAMVLQSTSWRMTRPFRAVSRFARRLVRYALRASGRTALRLYRKMPLSAATKIRVKHVMFTIAPFLFRSSATYHAWLQTRSASTAATQERSNSRVD